MQINLPPFYGTSRWKTARRNVEFVLIVTDVLFLSKLHIKFLTAMGMIERMIWNQTRFILIPSVGSRKHKRLPITGYQDESDDKLALEKFPASRDHSSITVKIDWSDIQACAHAIILIAHLESSTAYSWNMCFSLVLFWNVQKGYRFILFYDFLFGATCCRLMETSVENKISYRLVSSFHLILSNARFMITYKRKTKELLLRKTLFLLGGLSKFFLSDHRLSSSSQVERMRNHVIFNWRCDDPSRQRSSSSQSAEGKKNMNANDTNTSRAASEKDVYICINCYHCLVI